VKNPHPIQASGTPFALKAAKTFSAASRFAAPFETPLPWPTETPRSAGNDQFTNIHRILLSDMVPTHSSGGMNNTVVWALTSHHPAEVDS
jgi:hypothetical protein